MMLEYFAIPNSEKTMRLLGLYPKDSGASVKTLSVSKEGIELQ